MQLTNNLIIFNAKNILNNLMTVAGLLCSCYCSASAVPFSSYWRQMSGALMHR